MYDILTFGLSGKLNYFCQNFIFNKQIFSKLLYSPLNFDREFLEVLLQNFMHKDHFEICLNEGNC